MHQSRCLTAARRYLCLLPLLTLMPIIHSQGAEPDHYFLDQFAPNEVQREQWPVDAELLQAFAQTPEFTNEDLSKTHLEIRNRLSDCAAQALADCLTLVRTQRHKVRAALPNNPLYWQRFWAVIAHSSLSAVTPADSHHHEQSIGHHNRLVKAGQWWFYKQLVERGFIDIHKVLMLQNTLNHWQTGYQSLFGRMMALRMQRLAHHQLSFAMAQASASRDNQALQALLAAVEPVAIEKNGWGRVFWMEANSPVSNPKIDDSNAFDVFIDGVLQSPKRFFRSDFDTVAQHFVEQSQRSWPSYWREGIDSYDPSTRLSVAAIAAPVYTSYLVSARFIQFKMHVFPALGEIYAGRAAGPAGGSATRRLAVGLGKGRAAAAVPGRIRTTRLYAHRNG